MAVSPTWGPNRTHGKRSTYKLGCRCEPCCEAHRRYYKSRKPGLKGTCQSCGAPCKRNRHQTHFCSAPECQQIRKKHLAEAKLARNRRRHAEGYKKPRTTRRCRCGAKVVRHRSKIDPDKYVGHIDVCDWCVCLTERLRQRTRALKSAVKSAVDDAWKDVRVARCSDCDADITDRPSYSKRCVECARRRNIKRQVDMYHKTADMGRDIRQASRWRQWLVRSLRERDGDMCTLCGDPIIFGLTNTGPRSKPRNPLWGMAPQVDHIVPVAAGGDHEPENLQLAHAKCNHAKGARTEVTNVRSPFDAEQDRLFQTGGCDA